MKKKVSIKNAVVADKLSWLVMSTFQKMAQAKMDFILSARNAEIRRNELGQNLSMVLKVFWKGE